KLHRNLAIAFGIAFVIALALSVWLARSITQPLSNIAIAAQQLAKGDHAVRIRTGSRDEVGLLADTLNHMTYRLKSKIDELSEDRAQLLAMLTSMVEGVMVLDCEGACWQSIQPWNACSTSQGRKHGDTPAPMFSDIHSWIRWSQQS